MERERSTSQDKFWMVWVAGKSSCTRMHTTLEGAHAEARRLRALPVLEGRAVYILAPIEQIAGRRVITLKPKPSKCEIEPDPQLASIGGARQS